VVLQTSSSQSYLELGPAAIVDSNPICRVIENKRFLFAIVEHDVNWLSFYRLLTRISRRNVSHPSIAIPP
jgi:hypothetical protein